MLMGKFSRIFPAIHPCLLRNDGNLRRSTLNSRSSYSAGNMVKSLLYVPDDMANKVVSIIKPAVTLDSFADGTYEKIDSMRRNLSARGMKPVDYERLLENWNNLAATRAKLDSMRPNNGDDSSETSEHKLKELKKRCAYLEEVTIPEILKLPNDLHPSTRSETVIVQSHLDIPRFNHEVISHKLLGSNTGTLAFHPAIGPEAYYLKGRLAWLELAVIDYFRRQFEEKNFVRFSNPDFTKSIVVEACDQDFNDPRRTFHLERDLDAANPFLSVDLHLTGSASTNAFYAFHAKTRIHDSTLPLKYFAVGRSYRPADVSQASHSQQGLFGVSQASAMSYFIGTSDKTPAYISHDEMLAFLIEAYKNLQLHFRVITVCANDLLFCESLRTEMQLWSPVSCTYHTVASICVCDDFISRRLLMMHGRPKSKKQSASFLHACHGTAIYVPQFLACIVENNQTKDGNFTIPAKLQLCIDRLSD